MENSGQDSVIVELTQRLAEREAQIQSVTQQKKSLETYINNHHGGVNTGEAYHTLLAHYTEREEQLRVVTEANLQLENNVREFEKLARELQTNGTVQRIKCQEAEEKMAKYCRMEEDISKLRRTIIDAEEIIKKKQGAVDYVNDENEKLINRLRDSESNARKLQDELNSYQDLLEKSKTLAEEQINVLLDNEKTITRLEEENESMKAQLKKNAHSIQSKDALLNMQRQEMGERDALVKMYEEKFKSKNMDIPAIVARADEGERLWSKLEEREKRFEAKEVMHKAFRDENEVLQADKKRLENEVDELKKCFELYDLKLKGTGDKVHMPWLLSQLRDSVTLKDEIIQLEEVIKRKGYTAKLAAAEDAHKKKEKEMSVKLELLNQIISTLKGQTEGLKDIEVPVLLGKLEETLIVLGLDPSKDIADDLLSAASSDIGLSMSLDSFAEEKKWANSMCITARDFQDIMTPEHYALMSNLIDGFGSMKTEGLCNAGYNEDEESGEKEDEVLAPDLEARDDVVDEERDAQAEDEKANPPADEEKEADDEEEKKDSEQVTTKPDPHFDKVLKILKKGESDPDDWRTWFTPPSSPRSPTATPE